MILISGISGFVGQALARKLLAEGMEFCGITQSTDKLRIEDYQCKIYPNNTVPILSVFEKHKIEHVINLSVNYGRSRNGEGEIFRVNTDYPVELYNLANRCGAKSFLQVDSFLQKTKKPDLNKHYILSKNAARSLLRSNKKKTLISFAQLEHVYGPMDNSEKLLKSVLNRALSGETLIKVGFCDLLRDLIYVDDVASALCLITKNYLICSERVIEVGTGNYTNLKTVVETLLNILSQNIPTIKAKVSFAEEVKGQLLRSKANTSFLEESFFWKAQYDLQSGLKAMVENELKKVNQAKIY